MNSFRNIARRLSKVIGSGRYKMAYFFTRDG
jgi:hypothetical protein